MTADITSLRLALHEEAVERGRAMAELDAAELAF